MIRALSNHDGRITLLVSYHYFRTVDFDRDIPRYFGQPYPDIFLDSGAWSAFTQHVPVSLDKYIAFVKRWKHWFTVYSNLDDMRDPAATWRNQQIMEDAGLQPLPVFHTGEPWAYLERYVEQYRYIALGKIIPYTTNLPVIVPWLIRCFRLAADRAVYHGFGVTNWQLLKMFPFYSADSSSWGKGFRFGTVPLFDPDTGRFKPVRLGDARKSYKLSPLLERYGLDPAAIANRAKNNRGINAAIAGMAYLAAADWIKQYHGPVSLPDQPEQQGFRLYLANTHFNVFADLAHALRLYQQHGHVNGLIGRQPAGKGFHVQHHQGIRL